MKKLTVWLGIFIMSIFLVACGNSHSLSSILTQDTGKWVMTEDGNSDEKVIMTFEGKEKAIVDLDGSINSTTYSVSKNEDYIIFKSKEKNADDLTLKVLDFNKDQITIEISGSKGTLTRMDKDGKEVEVSVEKEPQKKPEDLQKSLEENDIKTRYIDYGGKYLKLTRSKGVNQSYLEMTFYTIVEDHQLALSSVKMQLDSSETRDENLEFDIENGKIIEDKYNGEKSDFDKLSILLEELDCTDEELVSYVQWYIDNNDPEKI